MPINPLAMKALCTVGLIATLSQPAFADGAIPTFWDAETGDPQQFSGSVTVTQTAAGRTLAYIFVYTAQIISTNYPDNAVMTPLGSDCWRADITNDFLLGNSQTVEVIFCERGEQAYWSLLDTTVDTSRLPHWVSYTKR